MKTQNFSENRHEKYGSSGLYMLNLYSTGRVNRDGRFPWRCEYSGKLQHPDQEPVTSIYYSFVGKEGPYFSSFHNMMKYREQNDKYRFTKEEDIKDLSTRRYYEKMRQQWK